MKWGDRLVKYYNMVILGEMLLTRTKEYGYHDVCNFMLWYVNGGKN